VQQVDVAMIYRLSGVNGCQEALFYGFEGAVLVFGL